MNGHQLALPAIVAVPVACCGAALAVAADAPLSYVVWIGIACWFSVAAGFMAPRTAKTHSGRRSDLDRRGRPLGLVTAAYLLSLLLSRSAVLALLALAVLPAYLLGLRASQVIRPYFDRVAPPGPLPSLAPTVRLYFGGLVLLFVATGLAYHHAAGSVLEVALPVYLIIGLVGFGEVRTRGLSAAWKAESAEVEPGTERQRHLLLSGFLIAAVALAAMVPVGLVLGLIALGGGAATVAAGAAFRPFVQLLGMTSFGIFGPPPHVHPVHVHEPWKNFSGRSGVAHSGGVDALGLGSRVLVALMVAYLVVAVYRWRRDGIPLSLALVQPLRTVAAFVMWLLQRLLGTALGRLPEPVSRMLPGAQSLIGQRSHRKIRKLPPREQVLEYYSAALLATRRAGLPRHPAETPLEYQDAVSLMAGASVPALASLTALFDRARYTNRPMTAGDAATARQAWATLWKSIGRDAAGRRRSMPSTQNGRETG